MAARASEAEVSDEPRSIQFLADGPRIPLDLIRERDAGEVVFIVGAGASKGSGFPLFWELTRNAYVQLTGKDPNSPEQVQQSVYKAYKANAFDFVLGHLEREIDGGQLDGRRPRRVRQAVAEALTASTETQFDRHRSLLMLARDQRGEPRIVTTNFDTLLERAWRDIARTIPLTSRAGADLPGPGTINFRGVLHLHGRLRDESMPAEITATDLVLTDADFGDAYLRSGWAARFLYDLVRRYTLVLVGYGAEDPPLKYLLSVIGADRSRFSDLRSIYAFVDSAPAEKGDVTGEWLAKGIRPILYERDDEHNNLYNTMADWARYVDDPSAWAEETLKSIVKKPYDNCQNYEKSLLELLLASPNSCVKAKEMGADFSLVRAIETARPQVVFPDGKTSKFRAPSEAYLNSLSAWTWSNLNTLAAAEWAVGRVAPPRTASQITSRIDGQEDVNDKPRSNTISGFSAEEIDQIERQWRYKSGDWTRDYLIFWHLIIKASKTHGAVEDMAYEIMERITKFKDNPLKEDALRLAKFMAPNIMISQPLRWDRESAAIDSPLQLFTFSYRWDKHPEHKDIAAALPDHPRWLSDLIRFLEHEITIAYSLAEERQASGGFDWLSRSCHRVASNAAWRPYSAASEEPQSSDPDMYGGDYVPVVRMTSAAWRRLLKLDAPQALKLARIWLQRDEEIFQRLYLWTLSESDLWTPAEAARGLMSVQDDVFWRPAPEAIQALADQWSGLAQIDRDALEDRILSPPSYKAETPERAEQLSSWYKSTAADLLTAAGGAGGKISDRAATFIEHFKAASGREPKGLKSLELRDRHARWISPPDAGPLAETDDADLINMMINDIANANADQFGMSQADSLIKSDPDRVLRLLQGQKGAEANGIWRRLLSYYSTSESSGNTSAEIKLSILGALQEMPPETLQETVHPAADWLQKISVGPDQAVMPFLRDRAGAILAAWRHLSRYAFRTGEMEEFPPSQGERLMGQAINRGAGVLAFVGIALADRGVRNPTDFPVLADAVTEIDNILAGASGGSQSLVAARVAEWLGLAERILPKSAEDLVLTPILRDDAYLSLLDVHLLYGNGLTVGQYARLEPIILREARLERLSKGANNKNVGSLIFRTLDRLAGSENPAPSSANLRSILQQTSAEGRISAARVCRKWFESKKLIERATLWPTVAEPFFADVWPLDAALRHPSVSQELMRLPAAAGGAFDRAVDLIVPLTVPFQLFDTISLFVSLKDGADYDDLQKSARAFVADHWQSFLDLIDAALGPAPAAKPYDLASLLDDLGSRVPEARDDLRFRRLYRLSQ